MTRTLILLFALLLPLPPAFAEHLVDEATFSALAGEFSGEMAQEYTRQLIQYHRIQGSPMMAEAASLVLQHLRRAGLEARTETFPSDGARRYGGHLSPMGWSVRSAELWLDSAPGLAAPLRLCRFADVPMCLSTYSRGGAWAGELVEVGSGTAAADYAGKDVRGKVALAHGYAASVVREAVLQRGALGVVIYPPPGDRPDHPDMVRYNGIWPRAADLPRQGGGFQISLNQYLRIRELMARGPVRVRARIDATLGPGALTLVHAWLRGSSEPAREVLITAHLDHPKWSANDNASGSGAVLELARALHALVQSGRLPRPRRTLHFMWVPEFFGTYAYVAGHPEARRGVIANLNLDMVGEDTQKTLSRFYFTRAPDSVPSWLDALLSDVLAQVREHDLFAPGGSRHPWPAEPVAYAPGSDHDILLGLGIPASMLGHAPDWTHHTSEDTLDKTDATEFLRVGVLAGAAALWLARAGEAEAGRLWPRALGERLAVRGERLGRLAAAGPALSPAAERLRRGLAEDLQRLSAVRVASPLPGPFPDSLNAVLSPHAQTPAAPRLRGLLPLDEEDLEGVPPPPGAGPGAHAGVSVLANEAVNLLLGGAAATPAEVAAALGAEFAVPVEAAWVESLLGSLRLRGLLDWPR